MTIIKLDAIDSTNSYLKRISLENELENYTIVIAAEQTSGRGQMGAVWSSEPYKNLTFSIYTRIQYITGEQQFYISIVVSLSIFKTLRLLGIPNLKIKWPNDILSANYKICGILIENVIKHNTLYESVIGIGLNVNQIKFEGLPNVSSMKLLTGKNFNHDEIVHLIVQQIKEYDKILAKGDYQSLFDEYESHLFRKDKPSTFKNNEGEVFMGFIKGITPLGKLKVLLEDDILSEYELKEIKLMY
ncbi:biotin--[acetyl-CoA-carboxylase] ligase [Flavobacteriaceae bacterium R38]|nr:biotin--[acetyl-CoA-carboxylase] ligase [Flavobacteriaceae bacterium R38]